MSEPREFDFFPLKRAARYLVGKPKAVIRSRREQHVDKITVFVDSEAISLATQSREKARRDWWRRLEHTHSEIWIHTSEFHSAALGESGVLRSGDKKSCWTIIEIYSQMKVEIQSDNSEANTLTDRLGA